MKTIIRNRYKDIEDQFKKLDRGSYGELTQDLLFHLFKRLDLQNFIFLKIKIFTLVLILNPR
jgi:hypothetical protein